jgi:hypothetical protein
VTFSAKNARTGGRLFAGTVIKFSYHGTSKTARIGSDGTASVSFTAQPDTEQVSAWIASEPFGDLVPAWKLESVRPVQAHHSAMVVADQGATLRTSTALVPSAAAQGVSISPGRSRATTPATSTGSWRLIGSSGATQTATYTFYGPSSTNAGCRGASVVAGSAAVSGNRSYRLPSMALKTPGYYSWRIALSGDGSGDAAYQSACSSTVLVRNATRLRQTGPGSLPMSRRLTLAVTVSGFGIRETHRLTARLYGPFPTSGAPTCGGKPARTLSSRVSGNGSYGFSTRIKAGWYAWRSTLSGGHLVEGSTSTCGAKVHVTR